MAHQVLDRPEIRRRLVRRWGSGILGANGRVDRAQLAARAFASPRDVRSINRIVHPAVKRAMRQEIRKERMKAASREWIVLDAPLLMEAGAHTLCDALVFVDAPLGVRRRRVRDRSGWSAAELTRRERFQIPPAVKRRKAQFTIDNSNGIRPIGPRVRSILAQLEATRHG
jgi:dephospho-CoA kinase